MSTVRRANAILLHGRRIVELNAFTNSAEAEDNDKLNIIVQQANTFLITVSISLIIYNFISFLAHLCLRRTVFCTTHQEGCKKS